MRRLHAASDDLDWLPKRYKYLRRTVIGGVWASIGGSLVAITAFSSVHLFIAGKGLVAIGAGAYWLGDRVSKSLVTKRLSKLASGDVDLARLSNSDDGELVHVRGVVRATTTIPSRIGAAPGVYRRAYVTFEGRGVIEEEIVDFQLVDAEGNAITIEAEGARWLVNDGKLADVAEPEVHALRELPMVQKIYDNVQRNGFRRKKNRVPETKLAEVMLRPGDEVEVVGYKSRKVDPTVVDRLARETPMRATLKAGKDFPVIISRVTSHG